MELDESIGPDNSALGQVLAVEILLVLAFVGHVLSILSVVVNVVMIATGISSAPAEGGEAAGFYSTFGCIGTWSLVGVVWAPLNAWGLYRKHGWARISTLAYWTVSLFTCCCLPFGAYGIYALMRRDVRSLFDARG